MQHTPYCMLVDRLRTRCHMSNASVLTGVTAAFTRKQSDVGNVLCSFILEMLNYSAYNIYIYI
jgi:hypothetical protein